MSASITLHPVANPAPVGSARYYSTTKFDLGKWVAHLLEDVRAVARPFDRPAYIDWAAGNYEERTADEIDTSCTWLVDARVLKGKDLFHPDVNAHVIAEARAIAAYLEALPDSWPVIVRWI